MLSSACGRQLFMMQSYKLCIKLAKLFPGVCAPKGINSTAYRPFKFITCTKQVAISAICLLLCKASMAATPVNVPDNFTVAIGGDMMGPFHPLPGLDDAGFDKVATLFRKADVGFANQEGSIIDLGSFAGYPAAENGGGYPRQSPDMAKAMREMGLTIVSKANNHATDYGTEGLLATLDFLRDAGLAQAGAGLSEADARAPGYVETPKGTAALVDAASTFTPMSQAGPSIQLNGQTTKPRPGISVLHLREVRLMPSTEIEHLRKIAGDRYSPPGETRIGDLVIRASDREGWKWEMDPSDETAILSSIKLARGSARFVLFSIHAHETAGHDENGKPPSYFEPMVLHNADEAPSPLDSQPADFEPVLFHAAIDAGADAVVRNGPHVLEGIEIYKGRPIFYGLGELFFDRNGRPGRQTRNGIVPFPEEQFESVVPVITYRSGKADKILLYPIQITDDAPSTRGMPHPADTEHGLRILRRIQALSAPFRTLMTIEDGVGVIQIP